MILPHEPTAATGAPLDLDLIRKYAIAGPRYTSYPPATRFTPDFDWERLEAAIAADNRPGAGPLSLYFHLPTAARGNISEAVVNRLADQPWCAAMARLRMPTTTHMLPA